MTRCEHCKYEFHDLVGRRDCPHCRRTLRTAEESRKQDDDGGVGIGLLGAALLNPGYVSAPGTAAEEPFTAGGGSFGGAGASGSWDSGSAPSDSGSSGGSGGDSGGGSGGSD